MTPPRHEAPRPTQHAPTPPSAKEAPPRAETPRSTSAPRPVPAGAAEPEIFEETELFLDQDFLNGPPPPRTGGAPAPPKPAPKPAAVTPKPAPPAPATPAAPVAATAPATPTPVSEATAVQSGDWTTVLGEVKKRRPPLASYLEQGVLLSMSGGRVQIGFPPAYEIMHTMVNRPDNRDFIARIASQALGHPVEVAFVTMEEADASAATLADEFEAKARETHRKEVEETMELPFIRDVLEEFGGEIVELRKPEP